MKPNVKTTGALLLVLVLAACGGSDEGVFVEEEDPEPSGLTTTITVSGATGPDAVYNGTYTSNDTRLNNVTRVNPPGDDRPEVCQFRFAGVTQTGSSRELTGAIDYVPDTNRLNASFIGVDRNEFTLAGSEGATVERAANRIRFNGAVLTSTRGTGRSITLTGTLPLRDQRPEGC